MTSFVGMLKKIIVFCHMRSILKVINFYIKEKNAHGFRYLRHPVGALFTPGLKMPTTMNNRNILLYTNV